MPVVYIDIDSLRPDHISAYGYESETTPEIDAFAEDAVRFRRAYVANAPCMPARAAWLTGRYGINNGIVTHGGPAQLLNSPEKWRSAELGQSGTGFKSDQKDWWTLPELFYQNRARTIAISSFSRHSSPWFHQTWHEFYNPQEPHEPDALGYSNFQTVRGNTVADYAVDAIQGIDDEEVLLYVQFWDPHFPYHRSDEEVDQFRNPPMPPHPTSNQIRDHLRWDTPRNAGEQQHDAFQHGSYTHISNRDALGEMLAHYDAEIRYVDRHVGRVLDALKTAGLYKKSLVVITGDHGEEFGEHGVYREHWSTYEGTQRVPLLVKPPADTPTDLGSCDGLVTNVDLPPTIADYAGFEPPAQWQGHSLRPLLEDSDEGGRDHLVVDYGLHTARRAVRTDRWKFIRTYDAGPWSDQLADRELYDLANDPWEQKDLADDRTDIVEELERTMATWAEIHVGPDEDALHARARR